MPPDSSTATSSSPTTAASSSALRAAAERGVEVDEVDPLGAVALPGQRGVERVAVAGLGAGLALDEADGLAVGDVDGGQQRETHEEILPSAYRTPARTGGEEWITCGSDRRPSPRS